jgi:hypothetical protein
MNHKCPLCVCVWGGGGEGDTWVKRGVFSSWHMNASSRGIIHRCIESQMCHGVACDACCVAIPTYKSSNLSTTREECVLSRHTQSH